MFAIIENAILGAHENGLYTDELLQRLELPVKTLFNFVEFKDAKEVFTTLENSKELLLQYLRGCPALEEVEYELDVLLDITYKCVGYDLIKEL